MTIEFPGSSGGGHLPVIFIDLEPTAATVGEVGQEYIQTGGNRPGMLYCRKVAGTIPEMVEQEHIPRLTAPPSALDPLTEPPNGYEFTLYDQPNPADDGFYIWNLPLHAEQQVYSYLQTAFDPGEHHTWVAQSVTELAVTANTATTTIDVANAVVADVAVTVATTIGFTVPANRQAAGASSFLTLFLNRTGTPAITWGPGVTVLPHVADAITAAAANATVVLTVRFRLGSITVY